MEPIGATKFKEQCLAILENLDSEGIVITKHGKPVARLIPIKSSSSQFVGALKGKIKIKGDIFSPEIKWHAES